MSLLNTINDSLPVCVTEDDVKNMPEFASLLLVLSKHINPSGININVQKEINEAEDLLWRKKREWLQQKILLTEARQLLIEWEMKALDGDLSESDQQFYEDFSKCVTIGEILPYLSPSTETDVSLLGLTSEDLQRRHKFDSLAPRIRTELENWMKKKCISIAQFYVPSGKTNNENLNHAKACQLPALVETHFQQVEQEELQLEQAKKQCKLLKQESHQNLKQCLALLEKICEKKLKLQEDVKNISCPYLEAYNKTLNSKLVLCNTDILCETYTEETIPTLRTIRKHLDDQLLKSKEEYTQVTQALQEYEKLGPDFTAVVDKYRKLKEKTESLQWSLDRLQKHTE